ncbi:MAG TPA: hypothetical protein VGL54_03795 [Solirubrobacteraceae bacterium]|jgi:hypothetical protein
MEFIEEHECGLTWVMDESMARASHALVDGGDVWLIDPVDEGEAIERAAALGRPRAVIQLLDRHNRDCETVAERLGIPWERVPRSLEGTPFEVVEVIRRHRWKEIALHWRERDALVVAEAVGTAPLFALGKGAVGVHPVLRLTPPKALEGIDPSILLVGHGAPVRSGAAASLRNALARSRSDIPRLLMSIPGALRGGS